MKNVIAAWVMVMVHGWVSFCIHWECLPVGCIHTEAISVYSRVPLDCTWNLICLLWIIGFSANNLQMLKLRQILVFIGLLIGVCWDSLWIFWTWNLILRLRCILRCKVKVYLLFLWKDHSAILSLFHINRYFIIIGNILCIDLQYFGG